MAPSTDSMFLFEIVVEDLKSCRDCKEFMIKSQFADVFKLFLTQPYESKALAQTPGNRKCKKKTKLRKGRKFSEKTENSSIDKVKIGQSLLIAYNIELLISNMKNYPIELSLWSKKNLDMIGSTHIPWSPNHIDYLRKVFEKQNPSPVSVDGTYDIFDELTSKRMATVKLNVKLSHYKEKMATQLPHKRQDKLRSNKYQETLKYTSPVKNMSKVNHFFYNRTDKPDVIKTINNGRKCICGKLKPHMTAIENEKNAFPAVADEIYTDNERTYKTLQSCIQFIKSDTSINKNNKLELIKSKSVSAISQEGVNILKYIFGNTGPYGNQVYCVGYFTVENNLTKAKSSSKSKSALVYQTNFKNSEKSGTGSCTNSVSSFDLHVLNAATDSARAKECKLLKCSHKHYRELPPKPDDRILLDTTNLNKECCDVTEKVEKVIGGMKANIQFGSEPCMCTCECKFGFTKRTTYCGTCGGYENPGEDMTCKAGHEMPFPCPIFHKVDKGKSKTLSTSGSDSKKKIPDSEKDIKKSKKTKKDDRFKFNYGYKGIPPQIGHCHCANPCTGTLGVVPKNMGWLWNAEDVPGMKFRPMWKPGAVSKHVVRLLKIAKNPGELTAKKRRKDGGKTKRPLKRPLLTVQKKDGEFTVTMETMKVYSKQRSLNQHPYEDKPVLTYTIGRTDEENRQRQIKKERNQRRLERAQRRFIQSTFRDMCNEICLKTYQQALEILPDAENPDCMCYPADPGADRTNLDVSCSCSEDSTISGTDTDSDEWIVEFTPPSATYYPTFKGKKVAKIDNSTQYTYLDYKVKLLDRSGNPVPRFFKGPDGKEECSDLGGFWSPEKKWLEINIDGYIGPDERWAPNTFIGPSGETVDCETGKFQATDGAWLIVGIDGFIDPQGTWKFYTKQKELVEKTRRIKKKSDKKGEKNVSHKPSEAEWSCFGDVTPRELSKMGILGHGHDRRLLLDTLTAMLAEGQDVQIPQPSTVPHLPASERARKRQPSHNLYESIQCKHTTPSDKGIVAVDGRGNKIYFRLKDYKNRRPQERLAYLTKEGISLNSFHLPCFRSFINCEIMKKQLYEKLQARYENSKCNSSQPAL